jgi:hypothetical protein
VISISSLPIATGDGATITATITDSGYYAVKLSSSAAAEVLVSVVTVNDGSVFCHKCMPGFDTNGGSVDSIRVSALSLKYTNTSSEQNNQGTITGLQTPVGTTWTSFVGDYNELSRVPDSNTRNITKGIYGFALPTQIEDFDLRTYSIWKNGVLLDSFYPLRPTSGALIVYMKVTSVDGRAGYFTAAWGTEYATRDVWRVTAKPSETTPVFDEVLESLKSTTQWTENPSHMIGLLKSMKDGVGKVISGALNYAPKLLGLVKGLGEMFG